MAYMKKERALRESIKSLDEIYDVWRKDVESRKRIPDMPLRTLSKLSDFLWGIHRKEILTIAGRTSQGKSALCMHLVKDLVDRGFMTYVLSLEMTKEHLLQRLFCNVMGVNNNLLRHGLIDKDIRAKIEFFKKFVDGAKLFMTDGIGYRMNELEFLVSRLEPKPDVVVLDFIQQVRSSNRVKKHEELEDYILAMSELAKKMNFAVIIASQINRGAEKREDKVPHLGELKASGSIEELSDTVLLCHWPNFYDGAKDRNEYNIFVAKQRHGATGGVRIKFEPEFYRFSDYESEEGR